MSVLRALIRLPTCHLGVRHDSADLIEEIVFLPRENPVETAHDPLGRLFIEQIENYLMDPAWTITLPLAPRGTVFQQRVWQAIRSIPPGQIRHYGELAKDLVSAPRAIGQACGANPFPLITPCHRVMAKTGPGGFAHAREGWLLETKRWLLQHESTLSK
ncbi:MAG: cysteine methyltransferase [Proteobacteria bacterium]|nr:cysteine methyltransferase [Pseudomonadota bacterium]